MEIESELSDDFEEFSDEEKVEELKELLGELDSVMKEEIVKELIEHYSSDSHESEEAP